MRTQPPTPRTEISAARSRVNTDRHTPETEPPLTRLPRAKHLDPDRRARGPTKIANVPPPLPPLVHLSFRANINRHVSHSGVRVHSEIGACTLCGRVRVCACALSAAVEPHMSPHMRRDMCTRRTAGSKKSTLNEFSLFQVFACVCKRICVRVCGAVMLVVVVCL